MERKEREQAVTLAKLQVLLNMAHTTQSRPDSGLGFQVKVIQPCENVPSPSSRFVTCISEGNVSGTFHSEPRPESGCDCLRCATFDRDCLTCAIFNAHTHIYIYTRTQRDRERKRERVQGARAGRHPRQTPGS